MEQTSSEILPAEIISEKKSIENNSPPPPPPLPPPPATAITTITTAITTITTAITTATTTTTKSLTVEQLDIEILPVVYDIIRCVEKDPLDNAAKQKASQECSQKILELQDRLESVRNQIKQLPGIEYNKEEQLEKFELLKNQLKLKQELIKKYKNFQF